MTPRIKALLAAKSATTAWTATRETERARMAHNPRSAQYKLFDAAMALDDLDGAKTALRELVALARGDAALDLPRWSHALAAAAIVDDPAAVTSLLARVDEVSGRPVMVAGTKRAVTPFQRTLARALAVYARTGPTPLGSEAEAELAASDGKADDLRVGIGRLLAVSPANFGTVMLEVLNEYDRRIERFGATQWSWPLTQGGVLALAHQRRIALAPHPYVPSGLFG